MLTTKEKIRKYLKHKDISQDKFSRDCNVSSGFLRQGKSFNVDLAKVIRDNYSDLNMDWLIYDEGNMLLDDDIIEVALHENDMVYENEYKNKYIEVLEENRELHKEILSLIKKSKQ